ncbi:MAG TPA: MarR family transcriptional regulator [Rhizomicrobium sp.]|nr:MarR family transcriptional regulator [Rhizomicrobium sp.]
MQQSFDRDLLIVLHDVARLLRTRFDQRARAFGMTRAQWVILARLSRQPGLSQNELAGICEVEPITVGRLIDRLEARGFVERRPDPTDRRIRRLHLLSAAQPILEEISSYREVLRHEITDGMDDARLTALVDSLLHIKGRLTAQDDELPKLAVGGE